MKLMLKILAAPLVAVLAISTYLFAFLLNLSARLFGIISTLLALLSIIEFLTKQTINGIIVMVIAFLVSPMGLPMLAAHLLGAMQKLRCAIQERVYGQ